MQSIQLYISPVPEMVSVSVVSSQVQVAFAPQVPVVSAAEAQTVMHIRSTTRVVRIHVNRFIKIPSFPEMATAIYYNINILSHPAALVYGILPDAQKVPRRGTDLRRHSFKFLRGGPVSRGNRPDLPEIYRFSPCVCVGTTFICPTRTFCVLHQKCTAPFSALCNLHSLISL